MQNRVRNTSLLIAAVLLLSLSSCSPSRKSSASGAPGLPRIAVFVPGVVSGSPIYEMMVAGVKKAAEGRAEVKVIEAGFNQAEWETSLTTLAAAGSWDLIVSSNPSLPALCASVSASFPHERFLLLDGELSGNHAVYTFRYNQREQAYLAGYLAALASGASRKIGLVAGQEYPAMNTMILPGYLEGARAVDPSFEADFRVVGNWYDASKGAELSEAILKSGSSVILAIAGGANQGVLQAAASAGAKVIWFDTNGYAEREGVVIGSAVVKQERAAFEKVSLWLDGKLPFGTAEIGGVAEGWVDFISDDPLYLRTVDAGIRSRMDKLLDGLKSGRQVLK